MDATSTIIIAWTDHLGKTHWDVRTVHDAQHRLAQLQAAETRTQEVAPTDSGDVRRNYLAEAEGITKALEGAEKLQTAMVTMKEAQQKHNAAQQAEVEARRDYMDKCRVALNAYNSQPGAFKPKQQVRLTGDPTRKLYGVQHVRLYGLNSTVQVTIGNWMEDEHRVSSRAAKTVTPDQLEHV